MSGTMNFCAKKFNFQQTKSFPGHEDMMFAAR